MSYQILFRPGAERSLKKLQKNIVRRIKSALYQLAETPYSYHLTKIKGQEHLFRIRLSSYRVLYAIEHKQLIILVVTIAHRRESYRDL